jgi:hypothetical protein
VSLFSIRPKQRNGISASEFPPNKEKTRRRVVTHLATISPLTYPTLARSNSSGQQEQQQQQQQAGNSYNNNNNNNVFIQKPAKHWLGLADTKRREGEGERETPSKLFTQYFFR